MLCVLQLHLHALITIFLLCRMTHEVTQQALMSKIVDARERLQKTSVIYDFRVKISQICSDLNVDGIRGDIVTTRAAKALAAFEGRTEVCAVTRRFSKSCENSCSILTKGNAKLFVKRDVLD